MSQKLDNTTKGGGSYKLNAKLRHPKEDISI